MTVRCAKCAWDAYQKTRDVKNSIRMAGSSGGFVWQGTSICENHMGQELIRMGDEVIKMQAKRAAEEAAKAAATTTPEPVPETEPNLPV